MAFYILGRHYFCSWVFGACLILGLLLYISSVQAKSGLVPLYSLPYHFPGGYFGSFGNKPLPDLSQPDFNPEFTGVFPPPKKNPRQDHVRVCSPNPFNVYAVNLKPSAGTVCHAEDYPSDDRKLWRCYHRTGRQTVSVDLFLTQADDEVSVSLVPNQAMTVHYASSLSMETPKGMPGVNKEPEPLFKLFHDDGTEMVENHFRQQSQLQEKASKALQITSSMMDTSFWQGMDDQTAQWLQSINFKVINGYYKEEEEAQKKPDEYRSGDWNIAAGLDDIILVPGASLRLTADMAFPGVINRLAGGGDEEKSSGSPQESHAQSSTESNAEGSAGDSTKSDETTSKDSSGERYGNDLQRAVEIGDLNAIETLMAQGVHPDTTGACGVTPLLIATLYNHLDVVEALLANGADPNIGDSVGNTPLLRAAEYGRLTMAKALLDHGAAPNIPGHAGSTPLRNACIWHRFDICKLLLDYGADPKPCLFPFRSYDLPLLHTAAKADSLDVVETLMTKGVDPNIRDKHEETPLIIAIRFNHLDVVRILLNHGALPNMPDHFEITPLILAYNWDRYDACKLLLTQGADPNLIFECNGIYEAVLNWAARDGNLDVVEALLENGADPNFLDCFGCTPLHIAAKKGHPSVVKALLANGADARFETGEGLTALHFAEGAEVREVLRNHIYSPQPLLHLSLINIRTRLVERINGGGQAFRSAISSLPLPTQIKRLILNPPYP